MLKDYPDLKQPSNPTLSKTSIIQSDKPSKQDKNNDVPFKRDGNNQSVVASSEKLHSVSRVVERFGDRAELLSSFKDAPAAVLKKAEQEGHDGGDVEAVNHNGKVYLFQDALEKHDDIETAVEEAILHEETHVGLRKMFKGQFKQKM